VRNRPSLSRGSRPSPSEASVRSARLSRAGRPRHAASLSHAPSLLKAADRWLADGKVQGWSTRTLSSRRHMLEKLAWWLENEADTRATLADLSPSLIRGFLAKVYVGIDLEQV
jgi:hypothetical protein